MGMEAMQATLAEILADLTVMKTAMKSSQEGHVKNAAFEAVMERLGGLEKKLSDEEIRQRREDAKTAEQTFKRQTIGEILVKSDAYASFHGLSTKGGRMSEEVRITGVLSSIKSKGLSGVKEYDKELWDKARGMSSLDRLKNAETTALHPDSVDPLRLPGVVDIPERPRSLLDITAVVPITEGLVEFIEEVAFFAIVTDQVGATVSTATTTVVADIGGFYANATKPQVVTLGRGTGTEEDVTISVVVAATKTLTHSATTGNHADGDEVVSFSFDFSAENTIKPLGGFETLFKTASAKTLAMGLEITKQLARDAPRLMTFIDNKMPRRIEVQLEDWMLYDATWGILTNASIQTITQGAPPEQQLDTLRKAITLVELAFYPTTGMLLHPSDVQDIDLLKDTTNQYLQIRRTDGRLWDIPVVTSAVISAKTGLVGAFDQAFTLYQQDAMSIRILDQHSDWALKNKLLVLAEMSVIQTVERPQSLVKVTFI